MGDAITVTDEHSENAPQNPMWHLRNAEEMGQANDKRTRILKRKEVSSKMRRAANDTSSLSETDLRNPVWHLKNSEERGHANGKGSHPLVRRPKQQQDPPGRRIYIPESVCCRVEQSWDQISENLEEVGLNFLLRLFRENPELLSLLPYGRAYLDSTDSNVRAKKLKECPQLRIHAIHVMTAVGNIVSGLDDIDRLVPALRALGKSHHRAGILDEHYKKLFKHLSNAIREKIGPSCWDKETAEAWEVVYFALASILTRPTTLFQAEPIAGWHGCIVLACLYFVVITPFRLAGFSVQIGYLEAILFVFDTVAVTCFFLDLCSGWLLEWIKVKPITDNRKDCYRKWRWLRKGPGPLRRHLDSMLVAAKNHSARAIRSVEMDQWVPWPFVDILVLMSFPLQNSYLLNQYLKTTFGEEGAPKLSVLPVTSMTRVHAGVPWTYAFGLIRLAAIARVLHALRCVENNIMLRRRIDQTQRTAMRIAKLVLILAFVTHQSACLWCLTARIELGPSVQEAQPSDFFPEPGILLGNAGSVNSYLRAIHWSWVNLAGIGNFDSTPVTSLECVVALLVHICGVTLYAVMTGHVVSTLEELTERENELGGELANLGTFMVECGVPSDVQERVMQGYIMRNVISSKPVVGGYEDETTQSTVPCINESVLMRLPKHLQNELKLYYRAVAIERRARSFHGCSSDFLFALAGELRGTKMLLPGDYLFKEGEVPHQLLLLDRGTMEIEIDGRSVKVLRQGDVLGKPWLLNATVPSSKESSLKKIPETTTIVPVKHTPTADSFSEWLDFCDGSTNNTKIRAMTKCILATGLSIPYELQALRRRFPRDFEIVECDRKRALEAVKRVDITRAVMRAQIAFKRRLRHASSA